MGATLTDYTSFRRSASVRTSPNRYEAAQGRPVSVFISRRKVNFVRKGFSRCSTLRSRSRTPKCRLGPSLHGDCQNADTRCAGLSSRYARAGTQRKLDRIPIPQAAHDQISS